MGLGSESHTPTQMIFLGVPPGSVTRWLLGHLSSDANSFSNSFFVYLTQSTNGLPHLLKFRMVEAQKGFRSQKISKEVSDLYFI